MRKIKSAIEKIGWWECVFILGIFFNITPYLLEAIANLYDQSDDNLNKVNYSNVSCLPPNKLCGTWVISTPYNATEESMRGWKDLRLILHENGTFHLKPILFYISSPPSIWDKKEYEAYHAMERDREVNLTPLCGKWSLVSYVDFDSKHEIPYYWVSLYLFPHEKADPIIIGSVIHTGNQEEINQYRLKRILDMAEYSSETYGFYLRRISLETNKR